MNSLPAGDASALCTLNVEEGLERLMGDRALYLHILQRFQHDHGAATATIGRALAAADMAAARAAAHTLKGAAGMIGAQAVYQLAAALEVALALPPTDTASDLTSPLLAQLELAMQATLAMSGALSARLPAPAPLPLATAAAPGKPALLRHLAQLLNDGDGAAIDVLEQSATTLAGSLGVPAYQAIAAAAHEFDFELALALLSSQPGVKL
ncbi:Hpt domain-containing protein [Oxalobacteraceae bacterium]|nr:Hpt domain-containing protein [Oxalobacteraceae bacterium]